MHNGITFRGAHSDTYGIVVTTVGRPIIPPPKQTDEEVPYRDGNVDFSAAGGRIYYEDKVLELEFNILSTDIKTLNRTVSHIAAWLAGDYGELIFDDMPLVIWQAKPADLDDLTYNLYRNGKSKIQFRCKPFNIFLYDSEGIPLDSSFPLDSDIPLGFGEENELEFSAGSTSTTLYYYGTAPVRPILNITLDSGVTAFSITINGVEITMSGGGTSYSIDCKNAVMPSGLEGDFFELLPGDNTIEISCAGGSGKAVFNYKHNFLFGDGF